MSKNQNKQIENAEKPSIIVIVAFASLLGIFLVLSFSFAFGLLSINFFELAIIFFFLASAFIAIVVSLNAINDYIKNNYF